MQQVFYNLFNLSIQYSFLNYVQRCGGLAFGRGNVKTTLRVSSLRLGKAHASMAFRSFRCVGSDGRQTFKFPQNFLRTYTPTDATTACWVFGIAVHKSYIHFFISSMEWVILPPPVLYRIINILFWLSGKTVTSFFSCIRFLPNPPRHIPRL